MTFARYIALGDSMSIDIYPAADAERRCPGKASSDRIGAASLLVQNDDRLWPEFRGRGLGTPYDDFTADGATTEDLLRQVQRIDGSEEPTLVTITIGGNDLLAKIGSPGPSPAPDIASRLRAAVARVLEKRPNAVVILATVYDPTDGTNRLPGVPLPLDREAVWLAEYNDLVRQFVATDRRLRLADVHRHFFGHGLSAPEQDLWYLPESIIEPGARGASEVRRLWLQAVD
jgi:lysophospholipase L1-like esterase